jgi:ATP citrate (pro-S)-lyase
MSAKPIREFDGKHLLAHWLPLAAAGVNATATPSLLTTVPHPPQLAQVHLDASLLLSGSEPAKQAHIAQVLAGVEASQAWLTSGAVSLVCKPDQLIKRRGKLGLIGINLPWAEVKAWIASKAGSFTAEGVTGVLDTFIVEPFVPHAQGRGGGDVVIVAR